jgi:hypothetical protein
MNISAIGANQAFLMRSQDATQVADFDANKNEVSIETLEVAKRELIAVEAGGIIAILIGL